MYNKLMKMTLISGIVWIIGVTRELDVTRAKIKKLEHINQTQQETINELHKAVKAHTVAHKCQHTMNDLFMNQLDTLGKNVFLKCN